MTETFNPSFARVEEAIVKNVFGETKNITGLIGRFTLATSIEKANWTGTISCYDSVGLLENWGLYGEEELDIFLKAYDFGTELRLKAQIYRIDSVAQTEDGSGLTYDLYFISKTSYKADLKKITQGFNDVSGGEISKRLFKKAFSEIDKVNPRSDPDNEKMPAAFTVEKFRVKSDPERYFYNQKTEGNLQLVIPNYRPAKAMKFVASKSYSKESFSNSYRFFENFDGYYFVTDEWLLERARANPTSIEKLYYFPIAPREAKNIEIQRAQIDSFLNSRRAHTGEDLYSGTYVNKVVEIDFVQHKINHRVFNYVKDAKYYSGQGKVTLVDDAHTKKFIDDTFLESNARQFMVFRDYSSPGHVEPITKRSVRGDQYYAEIAANRTAYNRHLNSSAVEITTKGKLYLQAGSVIEIVLPEANAADTVEPNKQLAGNYLVHSVSHIFEDDQLKTSAKIIKYGHVGGT